MTAKNTEPKNTEAKREVTTAAAAEPEKKVSADRAAVQKFKVEKLRENSMKLFGVTTSTFDGAFYGNEKKEMTIEEAGARIDKWLGKE